MTEASAGHGPADGGASRTISERRRAFAKSDAAPPLPVLHGERGWVRGSHTSGLNSMDVELKQIASKMKSRDEQV